MHTGISVWTPSILLLSLLADLGFPNPCVPNHPGYFVHPLAYDRFIYCDKQGTAYLVFCPTGFWYNDNYRTCIPGVPPNPITTARPQVGVLGTDRQTDTHTHTHARARAHTHTHTHTHARTHHARHAHTNTLHACTHTHRHCIHGMRKHHIICRNSDKNNNKK